MNVLVTDRGYFLFNYAASVFMNMFDDLNKSLLLTKPNSALIEKEWLYQVANDTFGNLKLDALRSSRSCCIEKAWESTTSCLPPCAVLEF